MNTIYVRRLAAAGQQLVTRAQSALHERNRERGASALEWVLISAITLAIVIAVGAILKNAFTSSATNVSNNLNTNTQ